MLGFIGEQVGHNWTKWKTGIGYFDYVVVAAVVGAIAYLALRALRRRRASGQPSRPGAGNTRRFQGSRQDGGDSEHGAELGRSAEPAEDAKPPTRSVG